VKKVFKKQVNKPTATALGTPIFHRRRRDWRDDQYLIEEINGLLSKDHWLKANSLRAIKSFKKLTSEIESSGFQSNEKVVPLAIWIRENLAHLASENGSYDLRVHALEIPPNIYDLITGNSPRTKKISTKSRTKILVEDLFCDSDTRAYVLERIQVFHKGNLSSYLKYLVDNERTHLTGDSATIMDLIHLCKEKLKRRNLKTVSNFNANQVDMWVPALSLGIEIRDSLPLSDRDDLINLLNNTNSSKSTQYLVVVCPDNLSDLLFHNWRDIERSGVVPNLSVVRVGDFGPYLDRLSVSTKKS
jgi:hypothetical protein